MNSNHWKRSLKYFSAPTFKTVNNKISSLREEKEVFDTYSQEETHGIKKNIFFRVCKLSPKKILKNFGSVNYITGRWSVQIGRWSVDLHNA